MSCAYSTLGNAGLMKRPKVSFLSSRKISPDAVMGAHAWAAKVRETEACIIGGFQSELEKDVLRFLLRGKCAIVIVEARRSRKVVPRELKEAYEAGRLVFVSLADAKNARMGEANALRRNKFVLEHSQTHVFGAVDQAGKLAPLVAALPPSSVTRFG